eukprot:jgi/Tetstr1/443306/TSEL_031321.t1
MARLSEELREAGVDPDLYPATLDMYNATPSGNVDLRIMDVSLGAYEGGALEAYTKSTHTEAERTEFQKAVMSQLTGWATVKFTRHTKKQ